MTASFAEACRLVAVAPNRFESQLPSGWEQGPGVYGGVVLGVIADAAAQVAGPERALRSVSAQLAAPVAAEIATRVEVETLRAGKRVSHLAVRVVQGGEVVCAALIVAGSDRARGHDVAEVVAPEVPAADEVAPVAWSPPMPAFIQNLELRPCVGGYPASGDRSGRSGGWVRMREPGDASDASLALGLLDAYWPALLARSRRLVPMASQTIAAHFVGDLGALDRTAPCLVVRETRAAQAGYADEASFLWSGSTLVAVAHQLVVAIRFSKSPLGGGRAETG